MRSIAELVEQPRDLELLLGIEDDADGLLAVAQRRVVQADAAADAVAVVQRARPDLAHAAHHPVRESGQLLEPVAR